MADVPEILADAVASLGGTARQGQQQMAEAVTQTLDDGSHLLVQAGTGTGKSLAYLVPVLTHAVESGRRAVISTATLALQRQVLVHDAPRVAAVVAERTGLRPDVALLKGWHNYLCKHKVAGGYPAEEEPGLFAVSAATGVDPAAPGAGVPTDRESLADQVLRLRDWAEETGTGDRDDLVPGVTERAWRQVAVTKMECLGNKCPMIAECFPEAARQAAREADVVVTNHAMLGIAAAGSANVLPEHEVLVVDEAHELADRVTAQASLELSGGVVERTVRLARRHAGVNSETLDKAAAALRQHLEVLPDGRLPAGLPASVRDAVVLVEAGAREAVSAMKPQPGATAEDAGGRSMARSAMVVLLETAERILGDGVAQRRDVLWCERPRIGSDQPRLRLAPLDVAGPMKDNLLAGRAVVLTSATLTLGGTFDAMARSLGLTLDEDRPWRGLDVGSPFDYPRQGILYLARHLPPPGRDGSSEEAMEELVELVRAAGGATLGLFSSRRAAEAAAERLRAEVDTPVLCQGEDQLPTLVRRFADDEATSLMGTLSLWQGVDVPGPTCRLVVIDRIPFPRPDDPVKSARSEVVAAAGGNGFMSVAATHAALLLAQGAGRLVRTTTDRGVVAVLDPRLATARYGTFLTRSMPPLWRTYDGETTRAALRRLAAGTVPPPAEQAGAVGAEPERLAAVQG
ncbi:ATP-dependent DNA helicase [Georgenia yuyongxinii]|uniref:ATP-dependent helicase DinG n=1 Tax=Georgenia yuyongxinii TaxID=2589797 RepID=A0A552WQS3_9MICO|nr:ATP-dependent DNA helicase [Georgenia yuyongxinii]TRW45047.1 ATP-dependent DNA helicase [Georgenia yuyongxinii]